MSLLPMSELEEMILAGWGDVPRRKIPANWREIIRPQFTSGKYFGPHVGGLDPEAHRRAARLGMRKIYALRKSQKHQSTEETCYADNKIGRQETA